MQIYSNTYSLRNLYNTLKVMYNHWLFKKSSPWVYILYLSLLCPCMNVFCLVFCLILPLGKNLLGSKHKAGNHYFAFILQFH